MTVREKAELIVKDIKKEQGTNPVVIFKQIAEKEYISIHGPEHHILDGASLLVAYKNAGGEIDLEQALDRLMSEGLRMPGAMCGLWGICGAITSIGAALAIIDGTGPNHRRNRSAFNRWNMGKSYAVYFESNRRIRSHKRTKMLQERCNDSI